MTDAALAIASPLVREFEGCVLHPYDDGTGTWTIGFGTISINGVRVTKQTPAITMERAIELLNIELAEKAKAVDAVAPDDASEHERAALISFSYNEGVHAMGTSKLVKLWRAGDRQGAGFEFERWIYAGGRRLQGLVNRRAAERAVFLTPDTPDHIAT